MNLFIMDERLQHLIDTRSMIKRLGFKTQEINDKIYQWRYSLKVKKPKHKKIKSIKMVRPSKLSKHDKNTLRRLDLFARYMTDTHLKWATNLVLHEINFCNSPISHVQRKHLNELKWRYLRKPKAPVKRAVSVYANVEYERPKTKRKSCPTKHLVLIPR